MTRKQIEAVAMVVRDLIRNNAGGHELYNSKGDILWHTTGTFNITDIAKEALAAMQMGEVICALKDAHPYITDDAIRARVGELIMKVEG